MLEAGLPIGIRKQRVEVIAMVRLGLAQQAVGVRRLLVDQLGAGLIQRHRVKGR